MTSSDQSASAHEAESASAAEHRPQMVVLAELADHLIADLPHHEAGRTARTVLTGESMRATVIALKAGAELGEHEAPPAATLYCITGKVTLRSRDRSLTVYPGQLVAIPQLRHAVEAHADSAVLLTVALK